MPALWELSHRENNQNMKHIFSSVFVTLFSFVSINARVVEPDYTLLLYPQGQNIDAGIVENGVAVTLGPSESNGWEGSLVNTKGRPEVYDHVADGARMEIYVPKKCNGQMVVVCPGGAYWNVCAKHEGYTVAEWFLERNIATCVLIYRLPNHHNNVPLRDVQNAFRYCRYHAGEWGVKQIGVMGFSAGGHLAASASTLFVDEITRPDFSILVYPVITFEEFVTHRGTRDNLLPEKQTSELVEYYSLENRVNRNTPAAFLVLSADDAAVPAENSIRYYRAMQKYGVPGELHILSAGGHGWGFPREGGSLSKGEREDLYRTLSRWLENRQAEIR